MAEYNVPAAVYGILAYFPLCVRFTQIYVSRAGCEIRATEFAELLEYINSSTPYNVFFFV
jgi:hypothetical protein